MSLDDADFARRHQLVELLIDCVEVTEGEVKIRYVIPLSPETERVSFCHLRKDYFDLPAEAVKFQNVRRRALVGRQGGQQQDEAGGLQTAGIGRLAPLASSLSDLTPWGGPDRMRARFDRVSRIFPR
jgi:hypothetical protein